MIYRVKQFLQGVFAKISEQDKNFINKYLNEKEQLILFKLRCSEQYHSLKVAYGCLESMPENRSLIRAALLHDIGKVGSNLNLINKSLVVLAMKFKVDTKTLPLFLQRAIEYKDQHPEIGYQLLTSYNIAPYELLLIKNHHQFNNDHTQEMEILQYYDNKF